MRDPGDELRLAERVRDATLSASGVAGMGQGRLVEAATYGVDRKVGGIIVEAERLEIHVVARYPEGFPLEDLAGRLRDRLEPLAEGRTIDLVFDDVELPERDEGEAR